ncbi:hypothetical protein D9619_003923 [Psilocybe cf. subviscida]|uniref:Tat pathway signal sequence n=1 Tax=Psilocybe cf. subviscida TaxID=2480587 RepID=A0A8H5BRG1_9AGAR|nr:hypothetical protein D9619_003923 [Psilocybe cf. subviscida]
MLRKMLPSSYLARTSFYESLAKDNDHTLRPSTIRHFLQTYMAIFLGILVAQTVSIILLLLLLLFWLSSPEPYLYCAIKYEIRTFTFGVDGDFSPYQGVPSSELDHLWEALYSVGFQRISKNDAARLPNKTSPIPGDADGYITELDVFHQLHCLNFIRKALRPDYYPDMRMGVPEIDVHVDHCVDSIRQSLMCSADISTVGWQWSDDLQNNTFQGGVAHKCRNFDMIQDWARQQALPYHYDSSIRIVDDIRIPVYRPDGSTYFP